MARQVHAEATREKRNMQEHARYKAEKKAKGETWAVTGFHARDERRVVRCAGLSEEEAEAMAERMQNDDDEYLNDVKTVNRA